MNKFFKGEKVIVIRNPDNQLRGKTRIGTVVSITAKPEIRSEVNTSSSGHTIHTWSTNPIKTTYLYNVQVLEEHAEDPKFTKVLYHLEETDLTHYTEMAEALYC